MAIVNVLRFNDYAGAMIADEEYWKWGRRKSFFTDHIYHVSESPMADNYSMQLVYGGVGHPPFHFELVNHLKQKLDSLYKSGDKSSIPVTTEGVGYLLLDEAQKTQQRRVNDHLNFLYGVTIDDVNRGYFEKNGKRYDINQKKIKDDVTNIVLQKGNNDMLKSMYNSRGVLMGIDPEIGFSSYYLNYDQSILAFTSGGFEAIGTGKYASGIALAQLLNNTSLESRRKGIEPLEGIYTLFKSALLASESYNQVGGYFSMALISGGEDGAVPQYQLIYGDRAKLATEVVHACRCHLLDKTNTFDLLDRLIFRNESLNSVEKALFDKSHDKLLLEWRLAGFKADITTKRSKSKPTSERRTGRKKVSPSGKR